MADQTIGSLPSVESVNDDSLIPAEQQGQAVKVTGQQFKQFAQSAVSQYVGQAQDAANQAAQSAAEAAEKVGQIGDAVEQTQANKEAAEAAQEAAEAASQGVKEYADAAAESASQAAQSASGVQQYVSQAQQAAEDAQSAKIAAELAEADAQAAKTSAQLAQTSAEQARDSAATSASSAQENATQAAQSASTAKQYSGNPPKPINGTWWIWNANSGAYEDTGIKSVLSIVKSYPTVAAMEADVGNMHEGDLVIISTEDISDPDNSKLYVHNGLTWNYLSDLSGIEGVGIASIEQTSGNHAPGTTDTYTITLTDGSTYSFTVYNGANGEGAGDMLKSIYDTKNRNTDIFDYVAEAVSGVTVTTDAAPTEGSANPVQSGGVYTALSQKQDTITGQAGQVVGFDAEGNPVAQEAPDTGVTSFNGRSGAVSPSADDYSADMIKFTDGQTFQQKYDSGELVGPPGKDGATGPAGADGKFDMANPETTGLFFHKGYGLGNTDVVFQVQSNNGVLTGYGDLSSAFHFGGVPVHFDRTALFAQGFSFPTYGGNLTGNATNLKSFSKAEFNAASINNVQTGCDFNASPAPEAQNFIVKNKNPLLGQNNNWSYQAYNYNYETSLWDRVFGVKSDGTVISKGSELKSVYAEVVAKGYKGTEDEFYTLLASGSGGGGAVLVNVTLNSPSTGTSDTSTTDIDSAFKAGKTVLIVVGNKTVSIPTSVSATTVEWLVWQEVHPGLTTDFTMIKYSMSGNSVTLEKVTMTGVSSYVGTDYTTVRARGMSFQSSTPASIPNGCSVGVYE